MNTNYCKDDIFWDFYKSKDFGRCQYPDCKKPAVGRVRSKKSNQGFADNNGYMPVCLEHLEKFVMKYSPERINYLKEAEDVKD